MPGMTALNGYKIKENMFSPDEGRIDAPTEENKKLLDEKKNCQAHAIICIQFLSTGWQGRNKQRRNTSSYKGSKPLPSGRQISCA